MTACATAFDTFVVLGKNSFGRLTNLLTQAKDPGTRPFAEGIDAVNRVYNRPYQVLTDGENVYVLPEEEAER